MIDDQALAAGRGALDQLAVPAGEERVAVSSGPGAVQSSRPSAWTRDVRSMVSPVSEYAISTASGRSRGYFTCSSASACRFLLAEIGSTRSLMLNAPARPA